MTLSVRVFGAAYFLRIASHAIGRGAFDPCPWCCGLRASFGKPPGQISPTPVPRRYGLLHLTLSVPGGQR